MEAKPAAWTWGWGEFGRLGHGDTTSHREPAPLGHAELQGAVIIACGGHHTVAATEAGRVVAWGWGNDGQLGTGSTHDQMQPAEVKALATQRVAAVACGYYHTAVVTEEGIVMCWGKGNSGQLGAGDALASLVPRPVPALQQHVIRDVSCGAAHTLALSEGGIVFAWGSGADGQLGVGGRPDEQPDAHAPVQVEGIGGRVASIAAGSRHSLCITFEDARLYVWGNNGDGRLGFEDEQARLLPETPPPFHQANMRVIGIAGGGHHSAVVEDGGALWTCGKGSYGQLGHGNTCSLGSLQKVGALLGHAVAKVACGDTHSLALTSAGDVWTWGAGEDGQLGLPDDVCESRCCLPRKLAVLRRAVSDIAAGLVHSAAIPPVQTYAVQAKLGELHGQVQGLTAQLRHAQASALAHQRERLLAEHKLQQAERQIAKLTHVLQASGRPTGSASPQGQGPPYRAATALAESDGARGRVAGGLEAQGAGRRSVVDVAVQTEGVLLLPTALRAHGARVQQQLALARQGQAASADVSSPAAGRAQSHGIHGEPPEDWGGGALAGGLTMRIGVMQGQGGGATREQQRCNVLQRIKAQRADAAAPRVPGAAADPPPDAADQGAVRGQAGDGISEQVKTFFDDVADTLPPKASTGGHKLASSAWRGWRRGGGALVDPAEEGGVSGEEGLLADDDDLLLEQELDLDDDADDGQLVATPPRPGVHDASAAQDLFYLPSAMAGGEAADDQGAAGEAHALSDEQVLAAALRLAKNKDRKCKARDTQPGVASASTQPLAAAAAGAQAPNATQSTEAVRSTGVDAGDAVVAPGHTLDSNGGAAGGRTEGGSDVKGKATAASASLPASASAGAGGSRLPDGGGLARGRGRAGMMSKVKKGISGFLSELKEELLTDRPDDGP